ncbi:hypothetical protein QAD02_017181 [Eretmocerus hayati]|uniref:Uncharacterized protein n=1 Tax=Eretmocerus hayati TaxID=131215 RepID=A0ACC2PFP9_9HYME|nr:hypothetical protein QAD02_017181 [Eretmocerus hayati]
MDVDKISVFTAVGCALAVGAFVLWGPSPRPRRKGEVVGIRNLGYTCFLNSLLQSLAACPVFIEWLQTRQDDKKQESFTNNLMQVIDKVNGISDDLYGCVNPVDVITSLGPLWNFAPGHQDAHELFHVVLSALQAELQTSCKKGCLSDALPKTPLVVADIKGSGEPVNLRSVSCNDIVGANGPCDMPNETNKNLNNHVVSYAQSITNVSESMATVRPGIIIARSSEIISKFTTDENTGAEGDSLRPWTSLCTIPSESNISSSNKVHPFSGLLTSQLICTECDWKSPVHFDKLESVSLPLPPSNDEYFWKRLTLVDLLSRLVSREKINDVQCDGCNNRCAAYKTLTFGKLPKCLCLHIPRTTWSSSGQPIKRDDSVIFNETLILDPFTYTGTKRRANQSNPASINSLINGQMLLQGKHKYYLYAVIEHRGPVDAGHFVCYRRGNRPGQWLFTSDNVVERTTLDDVLNASPYLLFYERAVIRDS